MSSGLQLQAVGKATRAVAIVMSIMVIPPIALLVTCHYLENPTARYTTYEAAMRAGAMGEGRWLPSFYQSPVVTSWNLTTSIRTSRRSHLTIGPVTSARFRPTALEPPVPSSSIVVTGHCRLLLSLIMRVAEMPGATMTPNYPLE